MERLIAVFNDLLESKTVEDVDGLLNKHGIDKRYHLPEAAYPKLAFRISSDEILMLKDRGILGEDNNIKDVSGFGATEKLLYALIWKNGDLKKVKHIVNGILSGLNDSIEEAFVFNQFGRYLSGREQELIIDQHVLRAFGVYVSRDNVTAVERYRSMSQVTKKEYELIKRYKDWVSKDLNASLRREPEYNFHVDKVLFGIGRYIKVRG